MQQPRKCDTKNQGNDLGIVAIQENILPVRGHPRITDGQNTITAQRHMIDTTASECCSRRKVRKRRAEARNRAAHSVYICGFLRSIVHVRKIRTGLPAMRPVRFSLSLLPCEREKGKISPTEQGVPFRATRRKSEENRRQRKSSLSRHSNGSTTLGSLYTLRHCYVGHPLDDPRSAKPTAT